MDVVIVKYNAGNIRSVANALRRLGVSALLTDDTEAISRADKVLLPGQGEAGNAMAYLRARGLDRAIRSLTQPTLGICIGQQLFCRHSDEGDTDCIGVMDSDVRRFVPTRHEDKVPQMGWNSLLVTAPDNPLFKGVPQGSFVYFVHSYYVPVCEYTAATADYIHPFSAATRKGNFYATQFHPEKSGAVGERILKNFLDL